MNKILSFFVMLFGVVALAQAPTNPTTAVTFSSIQGNRADMTISKGNGSSRLVIMKKDSPVTFIPINGVSYLSNSSFGVGQEVAPGEFVMYLSPGTNTSITNLLPATTYHIAVFEFNGTSSTSNYLTSSYYAGNFLTLSPPTTQATNLTVSNINSNTLSLSWTPGNGSYSIVLAKESSAVNANPVDLISYYANNTFYQYYNGPAEIGVGNFVMYNGSGNSVNIENLNPNATYHFAVFTYNGYYGPVYLATNPAANSATTLQYPTIQASNLLLNYTDGDSFSVSCTSGNGSGRIFIARENEPVNFLPVDGTVYTGNSYLQNATDVGNGNKVIYSGAGNYFTLYNLLSGSTYHIAVYEYAGSGTAIKYNVVNYPTGAQSPSIAPSENVVSISASAITQYQAVLTMQPGNGQGRLVIVRANQPVTYEPIDLNGYYSHSASLDDVYGSVGNGNEVVFKGTGTQVTVTNAQPNTTYHVAAYEYNGNGKPIYNKTSPALTTFTTLMPPTPTQASTNLSVDSKEGNSFRLIWTNGNGARRLVLMSAVAPITFVPQNQMQYTANANFSQASEIAPGEKIVFDGNTSYPTISGLEIDTTYYIRIFEYNGTGLITNYLTSSSLIGTASTVAAPTINSTNLSIEQINQEQIRVKWINGNGNRKLIIGRTNEAVDAVPQDLTYYNASSYFGGGQEIAPGQRAVYNYSGNPLGQESNAIIYYVSPGNTYNFKLYESNGVNAPVYNISNPTSTSFTMGYEPLTPSLNVFTQSYDGGGMTVYIGNVGGGQRRIIIAKEGSPVTFVPQDGITYASNANFSLGQDLGDGQKVVHNAAGYFANIEGLEHSKTYHYAVFEYGGTGTTIDYLTSAYAVTSGSTLATPTQQATSISFNATTSVSSNISWTNGNGENRIVIAKKSNPVDTEPLDYTNYYNSNQYFGTGGGMGNGNYIVHKGNANNFTLLNLQSGTNYQVAVFEYNGYGTPIYLKPALKGSFTTLGPPQEQAQLQAFTNVTTNSAQINCIAGSGQKRLIVMKAGSPITALPSENTTYTPNSYLGSGNSIGDETFVVYNGFDSQVTVTGLAQGVTYYVAVFEFNSFTGGIVNYLTPSTAMGNFTTSINPCEGVICPPGTECNQGGCFSIAYEVSGIVRDATTLLSLADVSVSWLGIEPIMTDSQGFYSLIITGAQSLTLTKPNYITLTTDVLTSSYANLDLYMTNACEGVICQPGYTCFAGNCYQTAVEVQVSGIVRKVNTPFPIVNVTVSSGIETTTTDEQGYYSITAIEGMSISFSLLNYTTRVSEPITSSTTTLDMYMNQVACEFVTCPPGFECEQGGCFEIDPCAYITCPPGTECNQGGCFSIAYEVSGIVRDATTLLPLADVSVSWLGIEPIMTDSQGFYSLIITGAQSLTLTKPNYITLTTDVLTSSYANLDLYMTNACEGVICQPGYTCYAGNCYQTAVQVSGIVRNINSLYTLSGVTVTSNIETTTTDNQGYYSIEAMEGTSITFSLLDYTTVQSGPISSGTTPLDMYMNQILCEGFTCPPGTVCEQGMCIPILYEVSGIVRDATTLVPLANVSITSNNGMTTTDSQGYYTIGTFWEGQLTLSLFNYQALTSDPITSSSNSYDLFMTNLCPPNACPDGTSCYQGSCFPTVQVSGIVRDAGTEFPLANVSILSEWQVVTTDSEGYYSITVTEGGSITLTLSNYTTLEVNPITTSSNAFDLYMTHVLCEGITCSPGFVCYQGMCIEIINPDPCDVVPPILSTWYADIDEDGFGDENNSIEACEAPIGYIANTGDCNDTDAAIYPTATEICYDGIDQNCNDNLLETCLVITSRLRNDTTNLSSINEVVRGDRHSHSMPLGVSVTGYRFKVTNLITNQERIVERSNYIFQLTFTDFAEYNTPYSVEVALRLNQEWMPNYGATCTITTPGIPSTMLAPTSCGATVVQMNNIIRAVVVPAAINYEYNVALIENGLTVATTTLIRPGASFNLLQLQNIPLKFAAEYRVTMRVEVPTSTGPQWSTVAGQACSVYAPEAPEASIEDCGLEVGIAPASLNTVIYASPIGGATQYSFTLIDDLGYNQVYITPSRYFRLNNFDVLSPLTLGGNYSVYVEATIYGYAYSGKDCNIVVPGGILIKPETETNQEFTRTLSIEFNAVIHPNPFAESFSLDVQTASQEPITITIYDMAGRLLETKTITVDETKGVQIGNKYPTGIYNAIVSQGEETRIIRVIKM